MDLTSMVDAFKTHFENAEAEAKTFLEQHLPVLADLAQKASVNPALAAILGAAHLNEVPEFLATIADLVTKADTAIESAKAQGVAQGTAAAQAAAAATPSEPETPAA
jgi:hypothetical protein